MIMTSAVAAMTHAISPESSATVRAPPKRSWRGKQTRSITILPWLGAPAKPEVTRKILAGMEDNGRVPRCYRFQLTLPATRKGWVVLQYCPPKILCDRLDK